MKDIFNSKLCYMLIAVAGLCFTSCSSDTEVNPYDINYVYTTQPFKVEHDIIYIKDGSIIKAPEQTEITHVVARCTKPAPSDIKVTYTVDKSLAETYNKGLKIPYEALSNVEIINPTLTIKAGQYISNDTLKIKYVDMKEFTNGKSLYVLPISISRIDGDATLSEKHMFYLTYKSQEKMTDFVANPVGTYIDRSNWSMTRDGENDPDDLTQITDDNQYTDFECENIEFTLDLGEEININTISLNAYSGAYLPDKITIDASSDGKTFTEKPMIDFSGAKAAPINILFYSPFKARYLKFHCSDSTTSWGAYISEINVYKVK